MVIAKQKMSVLPIGINVIAFLRVSTQTQGNGLSLDAQLDAIRDYADKMEVQVVKVFRHVSTGFQHDNLSELRAYLNPSESDSDSESEPEFTGPIKAIMVYSFERFSRRLAWADEFVRDFPEITIYSVLDQVGTDSPNGRHIFRNAISNGQLESDLLSSKMKRSVAWRKARGLYVAGAVPYGYLRKRKLDGSVFYTSSSQEKPILDLIKYLGNQSNYPLDQQTAEDQCRGAGIKVVVQPQPEDTIYIDPSDSEDESDHVILYIDRPLGYTEIARFLNQHGISKRGREWTGPMVSYLYHNSPPEENS
jgi:DNA invertase Pin-like site-specific DNA recombinase